MRSYTPVLFIAYLFLVGNVGCGTNSGKNKVSNVERILEIGKQDSLFLQLLDIAGGQLPAGRLADSSAFMIIPLRESCPSCRDKAIDSIFKYKDKLRDNRYIIVSIKGGIKSASAYFRERKGEFPNISGRIFLDSTNKALDYQLFENNPAIYYTANKKVYKKIITLPETIKKDLHDFFKYKK